jgi:putative ABC transport system permease protein
MTLTPKENQSPPVSMEIGSIDADYIPTIGMKIIIGRNFIPDNTGDINEGVILNQTACQKLGWEDPIGKEFEPIHGAFFNKSKMQVLGVVKDFHFSSLHSEIRPIAFLMIPDRYRHLIIRIQPGNLQRTIDEIQSVWTTTVPQSQFRFWFLDERLENQYRAEQKISQLLLYFALLVISISCLGLFGLAAFTAERRTKEIGIRKVNGAKISEILQMLNGDFIKWVAIAFVISVPLSYYAMNKWLENFAYKTTISWWIFALAGVLALGIALLTVSWQSWKAATRNPVEALRYE